MRRLYPSLATQSITLLGLFTNLQSILLVIAMVNVAVLGGSGHVGKTIVEAIDNDKNHSVIVLSRQVSPDVTSFS
jgi:hypothetical protein